MQDEQTIVVAGGGTAGWMAAAALGHFLNRGFRIRLIESDAIGTVGVGEATIPQIRLFLQGLGLDEDAVLRACGGTFKLGIEFDGWRRPGEAYMHAFGGVGRDVGLLAFQHYWTRACALGFAGPLADYSLNEIVGRAGRMHRGGPMTASSIPDLPYAYHLDAALFARTLRRFAERRGVRRTEGRIAGVERDGQGGDIVALRLDGGERIEGDLFVDCTGFASVLLGQGMGVGFEDWSRWLPCDRALAMPSAAEADPLPYTRATARAAGWQWRIPLQHRAGNGHVYASAFMDDEQAERLLIEGLGGEPLGEANRLRFTPGRRHRAWAGNVVALGLASGFLEPLESTSIHLVQSGIARLLKLLPGRPVPAAVRGEYNRQADFEIERIRDFLILHYRLNERDEPFWRAVRDVVPPDTLAAKLDLFTASGQIVREHEELFTEVGWLQVMVGQGLMPHTYHPLADAIQPAELKEYLETITALYRREVSRMLGHPAFIAAHCSAPAGVGAA